MYLLEEISLVVVVRVDCHVKSVAKLFSVGKQSIIMYGHTYTKTWLIVLHMESVRYILDWGYKRL
jgi:hypothetical protein